MIQTKHIAQALLSLIEEDNKNPQEVADKFWEFVRRYNLEGRAGSVLYHLEAEVQAQKEKGKARITLAQPTPEQLVEKIKARVGAGEAETEIEYDKKLIGGFRAQYKDKMYEASIQNNLEKLKQALS